MSQPADDRRAGKDPALMSCLTRSPLMPNWSAASRTLSTSASMPPLPFGKALRRLMSTTSVQEVFQVSKTCLTPRCCLGNLVVTEELLDTDRIRCRSGHRDSLPDSQLPRLTDPGHPAGGATRPRPPCLQLFTLVCAKGRITTGARAVLGADAASAIPDTCRNRQPGAQRGWPRFG